MSQDKSKKLNDLASIAQQNLTQRVLSGLFWMFSGTGIQAVLQAIVLITLARLLTPADFGLVGAALVVVGFTEIFYKLGIGPAIVQRSNLETRHICTGFTITILLGALMTGFLLLLAPVIASFFRMEGLVDVLRTLSLLFLLRSISLVGESLLQRELQFRWLAGIQVASYAVGYGCVGVGLAYMGFGVWALVGAQLALTFVKSCLILIVLPHPKRPQVEYKASIELIYFGGGFTATHIVNYIALQGDNLVVGRWLGAEALGLYGRAYQLMVMPANLFGQVLDKVLFPGMSKLQHEPERLATAYRRSVALIALVVLPISAVMFILAPELIYVLLGPPWADVIYPFQILAIGMLFRTSYKVSDTVARATGAVYRMAWRHCVYASLVVGCGWIGHHWGVSGVAIGVLTALAVHFMLMAQLSLNLASLSWKSYVAAHIPGLSLGVITYIIIWTAATVLRGLALQEILVLLVSSLVTVIVLVLLIRMAPKILLGEDGIWVFQTILKNKIPGIT